MNRRQFLASLPALAAARALLAEAGASSARVGICAFSCHQHWRVAEKKESGVRFTDAPGFYRYARELGAEGAQVSLRSKDVSIARAIREATEKDGGYYEADVRLPKSEADLASFDEDLRLARAAGATVARAVFTNGRRYEAFQSLEDFRLFHAQAVKTLTLAEPLARKHRLKLAIENHKDHTADELAAMMRAISSEWVGVLADTGNNIALLDDPYVAMETLAPFALSVHLKDMAVQPSDDGFLLSEIPFGTGALDLPRIIATLSKANPRLVFNVEVATRDPLRVPCLRDAFFATFPGRKATHQEPAMRWVKANPPQQSPPITSGKSTAQILAEEEANNRTSLAWLGKHLRA